MEFGGVLGLDGLVGSSSEGGSYVFSSPLASFDTEPMRQKGLFGSSFYKHGRSGEPEEQQEDWRSLKVVKSESMLSTKAAPFLLRSNSHSLFPDGEQMLSFSSSKPDALLLNNDGSLPSYHHHYHPSYSSSSSTPSVYTNAGLGSGSTNVNMHGVMTGLRGPFTPSQWMELEHQALIYKYIDANIPIPSSLLIPIRRSIYPSGLSHFPPGSFRSSTLGWGSFHLGFSGNVDPEPGRCRRTDGKKWRCSRDAVADQKYCERHMNRGRHRSRKHVEGHTGHASKAMPIIAPSQSASAGSGSGSPNSLTIAQQQTKSLQPNVMDPSPSQFSRILMSKENINDRIQDSQCLSMLTTVHPKPIDNLYPISKQQNPFEGTSSQPDFGLISTDSLLNPPRTSYSENTNLDSTSQLNGRHPQNCPLRHFVDNWPKNHSDRPPITWPKVEDMKSDRTQLSISILTDFSSSVSSPNQEKLALSPLRLSREFNPINEGSQRQASWIPISWEPTIGGPLGEVLTNTNSTPKDLRKNCSSSSLNLLTNGWDSSPRLESSPTGVLQKTSFGSLSSSTGSSPRAEIHKTNDSTSSLCDDLLDSTLVNPPTVPLL